MNAMENKLYQQMAQYLRFRTDIGDPNHWPGKSRYAVAVTCHPNILAELCAVNGYPNIDIPAEFAGVSREIMAAVVEDNEELNKSELFELSRRWGHGSVGYLSSPVLQLIDPLTNKGKTRRRFLSDLLESTADMARDFEKTYVKSVLEDMASGNVVTYARWSNACRELKWAQYYGEQEKSRNSVRTKRRVTA